MVATKADTGTGKDEPNHYYVIHGKKRSERPTVEDVSIRSRNGAPSRKGCVVNGQMTKASNE